MTPPPPTVGPQPGDLVAWRRPSGPGSPVDGYGLVEVLDGPEVVVLRPLSGSPSHHLRRPARDVLVLVRAHVVLETLAAELERRSW